MTLQLPAYDGDPATLQYILDQIAQAFVDTGGQQLRLRGGKFTATAGADTSQAHGLGSDVAALALAPLFASGAPATAFSWVVKSHDATRFVLSLAGGTNCDFFWIALG